MFIRLLIKGVAYFISIFHFLPSILRPYCTLHDLTIEYLRQPIDRKQSTEQYFIAINQRLIDGYSKTCNRKWSSHPYDDYYYQYFMDHAMQAEDHNTIQEIMRDFEWMNSKLQLDKTIYNLRVDLEKAVNHVKKKKIQVCSIDPSSISLIIVSVKYKVIDMLLCNT